MPEAGPVVFSRDSDDAVLVRAAAAGSPEAFDLLVERHRRQVYQVCYRYAGNHEDANDLAQEVFIRAYRGLGSFRGESAFSTWLYRVAVNVCLNERARGRPRLEALEVARQVGSGDPPVDEQVAATERAAQVRAAVARLPARQRLTVLLRVYEGLTHEEIARVLGTSVGTVKANFFHAVRNLRRYLHDAEAPWRTSSRNS